MLTRIRRFGLLLVLALTVSTALLGFAHRIPTEREQALAAFTLIGMPAPDFCAHDSVDGHGGHQTADCPACHLVGTAVLPAQTPRLRDAELLFVAKVVAPRESRAVRTVLNPACGLRAPPRA